MLQTSASHFNSIPLSFYQTFLNLFGPAYFKPVQAMTAKLFLFNIQRYDTEVVMMCIYDFITYDDTTSVKDYRCVRCLQLRRQGPGLQSPVWVDVRFTISKTMHNS